jgi:glycosyltransferase involved in cell wall biosynthesis
VKIRSFNVLKLLSEQYEVTALCFYRWKGGRMHQDIEESRSALEQYGSVEVFPIPQEHSRSRLLKDHFRSVLFRRVYTVYGYESASYRQRLKEVMTESSFDVVHMDSLDLSAYLPLLNGTPVVCVHHNVESALLQRRAAAQKNLVMKRYLHFQANLMQAEERSKCRQVALNVAVSSVDAARLAAIAPGAKIAVVPNGVDTKVFQPSSSQGSGIVYVGGTTWFPNRDALHYFSESILPRIREREPEAAVRWVGRASEAEQTHFGSRHGIEMTGFVPTIQPYVHDAACFIVPLRIGGGTRLKILDAWAMGKAIVSTSVGCEGLEAVDGVNILIRDSPEEFAAAVSLVLRDDDLRRRLEEGGRSTAEAIYDWRVVGDHMLQAYSDIVGS